MGRFKKLTERGVNMKAFENAESLLDANTRRIAFNGHGLIGNIEKGSYNVIAARLFGLSYPNFLRFAREYYNGTIVGKQGYSYITFKNNSDCDRIVKELNSRWDEILKERTKRGLSNTGG